MRYRRSYLGFVWTVLAPMLNYLVMGIVFSFVMRDRIPNYFVYYFSGAIFFSIISSTLNRSPLFLIGNEHYIKKIYIPKLTFVLNGTIYEITNFFLSATALLILGLLAGQLNLSWHTVLIAVPLILISFFLVGLGCLISVAAVYFRDLIHIIPVLVQATFFLTPVVYQESMIPSEYQFFIKLNPFYYFLEIYRQPLVYHQVPAFSYYVFCFLISATLLLIGISVIKKFDNKIVFKL
ncbi:MAG: ABC transporter permease [Bdellovibrionaceae bacterium]|nr:ABC transporter permease [Pseudobdellovibrionaceae bacterium]